MNDISKETKLYLNDILKNFSPGLRYVCAYGSGVFKQAGHKSVNDNMIDLIFAVNNSKLWHQQNMSRFPSHYSFLKNFSTKHISSIQRNYGAAMYYNTRILFNGRLIKYGVIDYKDFINDLIHWDYLYLAGRLHKPVYELKGNESRDICNALQTNLTNAVNIALLMSDEKITFKDLFLTIAGFSYLGDLRMIVGEDRKKVENIVLPKIENFKNLYADIFKSNKYIHIHTDYIEQDLSFIAQSTYLRNLPSNLKYLIFRKSDNITDNQVEHLLCNRSELKQTLVNNISKTVRKSSTQQAVKGVVTAGFNKTFLYSLEKLRKMMKSLRK